MSEVVQFRFRLRGGTAAEWAAVNPVLLLREPGVESDTAAFKIGDGSTPWRQLPYSGRNIDAVLSEAAKQSDAKINPLAWRVDALEAGGGGGGGGGGGLVPDSSDPGTFGPTAGGTMSLTPDSTDPGTFTGTLAGGGSSSGPAAALPNTPFAVRWLGSAWEFTTLAAAKSAGLDERQTVWFVGNPAGSLPAWARPGDVWTQE